ncbi:hypothetical protein [Clostridium tyrobutyricum]|uniref:hypothetical protein n=1 Tax=Clostridium tyrobutyricum TaxID=1519 RepID=UPI0002F64DDA|nr:hypothetical protein [Clostridium tyrobutyricum]
MDKKNEKIEALKTADEYMNNLKNGISSIVEKFQSGNESEALNILPLAIDGLQWMAQVMTLTRDVQKGDLNLVEFNEKLEEIVEAIQNEDYVLVGDLFEYEILPILENTHTVIKDSINI